MNNLLKFNDYEITLKNIKENRFTHNQRLLFITSMIEFKNYGNELNNLEILENSDTYSIIDKKSNGFTFKSTKGNIDLKIKCIGDGNLKIDFKGSILKNQYGKNFNIYLNYNNILINNKKIIKKNEYVSCDNPFTYLINVKENDIIQIHAEWKAINFNTQLNLNYNNVNLLNELEELYDKTNNFIDQVNTINECFQHNNIRIDFKNYGKKFNHVGIIECSDKDAFIRYPKEFQNSECSGLLFISSKEKIDMKIKCKGYGNLKIFFKESFFKNFKLIKLPHLFDFGKLYTNIIINDTRIISEETYGSNSNPIIHSVKVKDGDIVKIHVEWKSIDLNGKIYNNNQLIYLTNMLFKLKEEHEDLKTKIYKLKNRIGLIENNNYSEVNIARLDIKNEGTMLNDIQIINTSDNNAIIKYPGWFKNEKGSGLTFESSKGDVTLDLLCKGNGNLRIGFKGQDIKDFNGNRIPVYVNYTEVLINGEKIINKNKLTCHDKPFAYSMKVKNEDIVSLHLKWNAMEINFPIEMERNYTLLNEDVKIFNDFLNDYKNNLNSLITKINFNLKEIDYLNKNNNLYLSFKDFYSKLDNLEFILNRNYNTTIIDIKNEGNSNNQVELLENSDSYSITKYPSGLTNEKSSGLTIESSKGELNLKIKCIKDGKLNIQFKGVDFKNHKVNKIPAYVDYIDITINRKKIIAENTLIGYNKPFSYLMEVKNEDIIDIQAKWKPVNSNTPILNYNTILDLIAEIKKYSPDEYNFKNELSKQESLDHKLKYPFVNKINVARFDIWTEDSANVIKFLNSSDDNAIIKYPTWLNKGNSSGLTFESSKGYVALDLICKGNGTLNINFMGVDFRDFEGNRIPIYIDYTDISVNGKKIITENTLIHHDEPLFYSTKVKNEDIINIQVKWKPLNPNAVIYTNTKINYLIGETTSLNNQFNKLSHDIFEFNLMKEKNSFNPFFVMINTARFDISNGGSANVIKFLNSSDDNAIIKYPPWLNKGNSSGLTFESSKGYVALDLICKGNGTLNINFMGVDFRDFEGNRIPICIDYTDISVNGKKIITENTLIHHDEPLFYSTKVKNEDIINIQVKWKPINSNIVTYNKNIIKYLLFSLNQLLVQVDVSKKDLNKSIENLFVEKENNFKDLDMSIRNSINLNKIPLFDKKSPMVSIIILNHNGEKHIKRIIPKIEDIYDDYPNVELILVDNNSNDNYKQYLSGLKRVPYKLIENEKNYSFSYANNQAAKIANGDYLLFLNNDIEPLKGFLNHMMDTMLNKNHVGAVGAKLFYPDCTGSNLNSEKSYSIQHAGIIFKESDGYIKPFNRNNGTIFKDDKDKKLREMAAVTAATLLVKKSIFFEVKGFDENYIYGYEDVDLCLKLHYKGYTNFYNPKAVLYHYEFGTQEKNNNLEVKERRIKNHKFFVKRWNKWLRKQLIDDKLNNKRLFTDTPLTVSFVVTQSDENTTAGDYFTALTLAKQLKKYGWNIQYQSRRKSKGQQDWYHVDEDVDVLISLLDAYDLTKVECDNGLLVKIAWLRNWFERWIENPSFRKYDLVFASSQYACNYIKETTGINAILYPLASDNMMFNSNISSVEKYECDYCFTGSYWDAKREIIEYLNPDSLDYDFNLYGVNWNKISKFSKYAKGFVHYNEMPRVYASCKIVIDDANHVTKEWGSVNSRIFDSLSSGKLVITNGTKGNQELFNGQIPEYHSKDELTNLINYYMKNSDEREKIIKKLQRIVLENHTYQHRAKTLREVLEDYYNKPKIVIKTPIPTWNETHDWGDFYVAEGLREEFEKKGYGVRIQMLNEWYDSSDSIADNVLVLRGLSYYEPQVQHFNVMWNISHPDLINIKEFESYDYIFIASKSWTEKIANMINTPVSTMLQCTDIKRFYPDYDKKYKSNLLFVGNSRGVYRKILKDLIPTKYHLSVYGKGWENIIDAKYIKSDHINNKELRKAYSSCDILLNDHWDDMREKGFISNRIFDAVACGSIIISDDVIGLEDIFSDRVFSYKTSDELNELIKKILKEKINYDVSMINGHTYEDRVNQIINILP